MNKSGSRSGVHIRHRRWLAATTAIVGFMAVPAYGQALPNPGNVDISHSNGGSDPVFNPGNNRLDIRLRADNTVIDWKGPGGFNVPENQTVRFERNGGAAAVLNRDLSGNPSKIFGTLSSGSNVAVWVMNGSGIMVGSNANINTGSLVLSTLNVENTDFLDGNRTYGLKTAPGSQSAITVSNGAQIKVDGGNRGLIMVAPRIDAYGSFDATNQDAAFITASDVDLTFNPNSPLSIKINRGTAVSGRSQLIRGTVAGANALFALASQGTVTDALLQVDAKVTTATSGTRRIILSAGSLATAVDGVTVAGTPADTGGIANLLVRGDLTSTDNDGSDILAGATGSASFTSALSSRGDIRLTGGGDVTVAGAVTARDNYVVDGRTVTLGGSIPVLQSANGAITITASRTLTGLAGLTLVSNADGSLDREALTLAATFDGTSTNTPSGTINFAPGTILKGGANRESSVRILSGAANGSVALGTVTARSLVGAVGAPNFDTGIIRQAAVTTGDISLTDQIKLQGTTLTTGALTSGDAVTLTSTAGALKTGAIDADRAVTLTSAGALTTGAIQSGRSILVDAVGDAVFGGDLDADDDLTLRGASVRLNGQNVTSGGTIDLQARVGGITSVAGLNLTSTSNNNTDFVRLQAAGTQGINLSSTGRITAGVNRALRVGIRNQANGATLVLGDVTARALTGLSIADGNPATDATTIVGSGSLTFGNLDLIESFSARSTGGNISIASIAVTGPGQGISLAAPIGALSVQSTIRASGDVTLVGGSPIILDKVESTNGLASVTSNSTVRLNTLAGAQGVSATGASVTIQNVQGGIVSLNSTAGGIILNRVDGDSMTLNAVGGNIVVTDAVTSNGSVSVTGTDSILFTKKLQASGGGVVVNAGNGQAAMLGDVIAAGDYRVTGKSVELAGRQEARGVVAITATGGGIVGRPGLVLASDTDGTAGEALALSATGGSISLAANSLLSGGKFGQSAVTVMTDAGSVALGDVTARSLTIAAPTGATTPIATISTRNLSLSDGFTAAANGVTTGTIGVSGGGVAINGGAGAVQTGAISAAGAVSLTGGSVSYEGSISGQGVDISAATGNVSGVSGGGIASVGAINVSAANGTITLGRLTATGADANVKLESLGAMSVRGVTADGTATLKTGAGADIRLEEGLRANGAVDVTAGRNILASFIRSTDGTLTVSAPTGDVTGIPGGDRIALQAGLGKAFSLTVGNAVDLGSIEGGPTSITASKISVGAINVGGNAISLNATGGDLTVLGNVIAGDTTLTSTGVTRLQTVTATGSVTLSGTNGLNFVNIKGTNVSASSGGEIRGDSATATGGMTITGGSLSLGEARATNGPLALTATSGEAELGSLSSGQDITVLASGRATVDGTVTAVGNYQVTGKSVVLGGQQGARGAVTITATAGAIFGQSGLKLASDTDGAAGEALTLSATGGGILLTSNSLLSGGKFGQSGVTVTTDAGSVALGDVTARSLTIAAPTGATTPIATISTRNLSLSDGFTAVAANGVTTGTIGVSGGGVAINGGAGAVQTGAISATDAVSLIGGSVDYGSISGRGVDISAATGNISGGDITSIGAIGVRAANGTINVGRLAANGADGNVSLTSSGTLSATRVRADGTAALVSGGDVRLEEGLQANGAVDVTAGGDIRASFIASTGGTLTVSAPTGDVTGFNDGDIIDLSAGPGKAFSLTVGRAVNLGSIEGGPTSITASKISIGAINVGGNAISLNATGGDLTVLGNVIAGDTTLTSTGVTRLQTVTATGSVTLSGTNGLNFVNIKGTNVSASSGGEIRGDSATATGGMTITGGSLSLGEARATNGPLALTATSGAVELGSLSSGQDITVLASGHAAMNGDVTAGGAYKVTGASVAFGDEAATQRAGGAIVITALNGDISGRPGLTLTNLGATGAPAIVLDAAGAIALAGSTLRTGGALGLRAGVEKTIELGTIEAGIVGGYDGNTAGGALRHSASVTTGDIVTGTIDIGLSSGNLTTGTVTATGAVNLVTTSGGITTGAIQGGAVRLSAGGLLSAASILTPGSASLGGAQVQIDSVRAASIQIRTVGALTGIGDGRVSLRSTAGDITVDAGNMKLAAVASSEALTLSGNAIDIAGKLTASRLALVKARSTLTMADADIGGDLGLEAGGALTAGAIAAKGAITVLGRGIKVTNARAGDALSLTSGADLQLGEGQAGGAAIIDAVGLATLGALSAGPSITIRASDVALTGNQRAGAITFENRAAATLTMRLGDNTDPSGFRLSNAEIALVNADAVRFDQGAGALQIGTITFGADTGRRTVDMLTTGAVAVDGTVKGSGLGRTFRIGGGIKEGSASEIRVTATSSGGGRLLFDNANLDLRGDRIAVGLALGFLNALVPGAEGNAQALSFINNGNSALYNAGLGGGFYDPAATILISAQSLSMRFADYALIQNTAVPGQFSGVTLGGTLGNPVTPALSVRTTGKAGGGGFALFGTINAVGGPSASLLGPSVLDIESGLLGNSRINGCLAGSGVGCLTTIVIQPTLQIFKWNSDDVFGVAQDVSTPFDPVVGGNNEELLTGLPALSPEREPAEEGLPQ